MLLVVISPCIMANNLNRIYKLIQNTGTVLTTVLSAIQDLTTNFS